MRGRVVRVSIAAPAEQAESGADAFTIQRLMGHSSVVVSQRYVHPSQKKLEVSVQRMEALAEKARAAIRPALIERPESDQQDFMR